MVSSVMPALIKARLGHSDPAIMLRVYAHVISERMASAADVFAASIRNSA
ncbi:hypothetical protein [Microtetraspora malaysiensis]|nr:hypothetical protein [Microtetraspora malaysiensis]